MGPLTTAGPNQQKTDGSYPTRGRNPRAHFSVVVSAVTSGQRGVAGRQEPPLAHARTPRAVASPTLNPEKQALPSETLVCPRTSSASLSRPFICSQDTFFQNSVRLSPPNCLHTRTNRPQDAGHGAFAGGSDCAPRHRSPLCLAWLNTPSF